MAMKIGNSLSSEESSPRQLIEQARAAERAGFQNLWISDHYPSLEQRGGSVAVRVDDDRRPGRGSPNMRLTTAVTAPRSASTRP